MNNQNAPNTWNKPQTRGTGRFGKSTPLHDGLNYNIMKGMTPREGGGI